MIFFFIFTVLTEDDHSPNDNSSNRGGGATTSNEYSTANESELVKSENAGNSNTAAQNASIDPLVTSGGGSEGMERSASGATSATGGQPDG